MMQINHCHNQPPVQCYCKPSTALHATTLWLLFAGAPLPAHGYMHHPGKRATLSFLLPQLQASYRYRPSQNRPRKWVVVTSDPNQLMQHSDVLPLATAAPMQHLADTSSQQQQQGQQHAVTVGLLWQLHGLLASKHQSTAWQLHRTHVKQRLARLHAHHQAIQKLHKPCSSNTLQQQLTCWAQQMHAQALLQAIAHHPNGNRRKP